MGRYRFALAPRWWVGHLVVAAACVTMVLLGQWQWHVAHVRHGDIRNYAYAFQWWAFTAFALLMWGRVVRDQAGSGTTSERPVSGEGAAVPYRRYVLPSVTPMPPDPERDRYNAYLRSLAEGAHE